ncbi:MAG: glycosyltransferase family 4 protein [Burkholderiales bacterium]
MSLPGRSRPRLAFISPVFLFPADAGGKIRTGNILRGLKGGAFDLTLVSPASAEQSATWRQSLQEVSDQFVGWAPTPTRPRWQRVGQMLSDLPVNVASDRTPAALSAVAKLLEDSGFDLVVFDFVHAAVLRPATLKSASLCFTHNVEAEIFARHAKTADNAVMRAVWRNQHRKMQRFEQRSLSAFDGVVAVSERDAQQFKAQGLTSVYPIPTGVDLDFFSWQPPPEAGPPTVVFTGSMDWEANVDGVGYFLDEVWPQIRAAMPQARFVIIGRNPPAGLLAKGKLAGGVEFTGFVDDVRTHARAAQAFVIPLRVGGGTRIKAFEAMAMGCPVVSTALGMEGLPVKPGEDFLLADDAKALADSVLRLLQEPALRMRLSQAARACVESRFGHRVASEVFERACLDTLDRFRQRRS